MKILFISDIHGLVDNLYLIKNLDNENNFDKIIILGDLFEGGYSSKLSYNPEEVKRILLSFKERLIIIRGNRDFGYLEEGLDIKDGPLLISIDKHNIILAHGHESDIFYNTLLIHGHKHIPLIEVNRICVGSISLPRNNSKASYGVYYNDTITLYDFDNNIIKELELKQ